MYEYPAYEKPSAPAPSSLPPPGPSEYPPQEKPYTNYPHPPQPGHGGYPPQLGQQPQPQPQVVEGIPVGRMDNTSPQPLGIQTTPQAAPQTGYWSTGLCDCFSDIRSCCLVLWCPCVAFGQLSEIVDKGSSSCGCNGSLYAGLCLLGGVATVFGVPVSCQWIYSCTYRGKLKQDINMPPSCCEECCVHFWCEPCALCQEYRELQNQGYDLPLGWNGNQEKRRGQQPAAMVAAPIAPRTANNGAPLPATVAAPIAPGMAR